MKLSELKSALSNLNEVNFVLPNGSFVPRHFHLTEIGLTTKQFIDCGGAIHTDKKANLQLWVAADVYHRLAPAKLSNIIETSLPLFDGEDLDIEVEFETETVGKYAVELKNEIFQLKATKTDCLALDNCGIGGVIEKAKTSLAELGKGESCCTPGGGCC